MGLTTNIRIPLLRLSEGPNSSSLVAKRSISPRNGDSPNGIVRNTKVCANPEYFNLMVPMLNICPTMDLYLNGARFKLNWLVCKPSIGRKIKKLTYYAKKKKKKTYNIKKKKKKKKKKK